VVYVASDDARVVDDLEQELAWCNESHVSLLHAGLVLNGTAPVCVCVCARARARARIVDVLGIHGIVAQRVTNRWACRAGVAGGAGGLEHAVAC
jgi:hypothetical protein